MADNPVCYGQLEQRIHVPRGMRVMLSTDLAERAIQVNVALRRAFVRLREALQVTRELAARLKDLEQKVTGHAEDLMKVFRAINDLRNPPPVPPSRPIGFHVRASRARYGKGT